MTRLCSRFELIEQKSDLIAFLRALTDTNLLDDPRWANPWTQQHKEIR
jgi:hypothetical protein